MATNIKQRLSALVEDMSPRTRQWATIGGISAVAVAVLWAAFSMGSSDAKPGATGSPKGSVKPTNVDVMAPGSQVKDVDTWVGKAGKKLDQFESDRAEQQRINREHQQGFRLTQRSRARAFPLLHPCRPVHDLACRRAPRRSLATSVCRRSLHSFASLLELRQNRSMARATARRARQPRR